MEDKRVNAEAAMANLQALAEKAKLMIEARGGHTKALDILNQEMARTHLTMQTKMAHRHAIFEDETFLKTLRTKFLTLLESLERKGNENHHG